MFISVHPRTAEKFEKFGLKPNSDKIKLLEPLGFFDFVKLGKKCAGSFDRQRHSSGRMRDFRNSECYSARCYGATRNDRMRQQYFERRGNRFDFAGGRDGNFTAGQLEAADRISG